MQILTGKHGTSMRLTKTEERKLLEARNLLRAIAKHGDQAIEADATNAAAYITGILKMIKDNEPAETETVTT